MEHMVEPQTYKSGACRAGETSVVDTKPNGASGANTRSGKVMGAHPVAGPYGADKATRSLSEIDSLAHGDRCATTKTDKVCF